MERGEGERGESGERDWGERERGENGERDWGRERRDERERERERERKRKLFCIVYCSSFTCIDPKETYKWRSTNATQYYMCNAVLPPVSTVIRRGQLQRLAIRL